MRNKVVYLCSLNMCFRTGFICDVTSKYTILNYLLTIIFSKSALRFIRSSTEICKANSLSRPSVSEVKVGLSIKRFAKRNT